MGGGRQGAEGAGEEGAGYLVRGRPAPLPLPTAPTMRGRQAAPAPFPPPPGGRPRPPLLGVYGCLQSSGMRSSATKVPLACCAPTKART